VFAETDEEIVRATLDSDHPYLQDVGAGRREPRRGPRSCGEVPLILLSAKSAGHFLNSSSAHTARARAAEEPARLDIAAADAAARGIDDGDDVEVVNGRASVRFAARVGDRVPAGVIAAPSGWWASHSPSGLSVNALTADGLSDRGDGPDFHDTLVEVRRAMTRAGST
jgi:anaerobic selenocysteine-containing dehydrogenase